MTPRPHWAHFVRGMFSGIEWCFLLVAYLLAGYHLIQGHTTAAITLFLTGVLVTACMWAPRALFPFSTQKTLQPYWSQLVHEARKRPVGSMTFYGSTLNTDCIVGLRRRRMDATAFWMSEETLRAAEEAHDNPGSHFTAYGHEITFSMFYPVVACHYFGDQFITDANRNLHPMSTPERTSLRAKIKSIALHSRTGVLAPRSEELAEVCKFIAEADIIRNIHRGGEQ